MATLDSSIVDLQVQEAVLVFEMLDRTCRDGEAEAYGRAVVADLAVTLDGHDVPLSLDRVEMPAAEELRDGRGTIRIEASMHASASSGRHRLIIRNGHLPHVSVYLANALLPDAAGVRIVQQTRDVHQQTFWLDYEIRGVNPTGLAWLLAAGTMQTMLMCRRRVA